MAKGIEKFIEKIAVQTAVYWGKPVPDGYGGFAYSDPVEIKVRWEGSTEVITLADGTQYTSRAKVFITQDVDEEGYLYLGTLDDLSSTEESDPSSIEGAWKIRRFDKTPMIFKTDEWVRICYL